MTNKVKNEFQFKGFPLIKIKSRELINKLQGGSFYMNSLKVYRKMYKNCKDIVIGDPNEGKLFVHDAILQNEELGIHEVLKDYAVATNDENDFVFCMFGVNPNKHHTFRFTEEQKQKLISFDDTVLLITDVYEFCRRIKNAATEKNLIIKSNFVDYYDDNDASRFISLLVNGTENIVFHKRKEYSYQQEYRFTIPNHTGADHLELDIGNITSISKIISTKELLNSYMVNEVIDVT